MSRKNNHETEPLFGLPPELVDAVEQVRVQNEQRKQVNKVLGPGPVYQGVAKQIRRLTADGAYKHLEPVVDPIEHAGTIAAARSLARTLDKQMGHNPSGWVANGRDLAPLLEQLQELMATLNPDQDRDALEDFLNSPEAPREESADVRAAQASHPEV